MTVSRSPNLAGNSHHDMPVCVLQRQTCYFNVSSSVKHPYLNHLQYLLQPKHTVDWPAISLKSTNPNGHQCNCAALCVRACRKHSSRSNFCAGNMNSVGTHFSVSSTLCCASARVSERERAGWPGLCAHAQWGYFLRTEALRAERLEADGSREPGETGAQREESGE